MIARMGVNMTLLCIIIITIADQVFVDVVDAEACSSPC